LMATAPQFANEIGRRIAPAVSVKPVGAPPSTRIASKVAPQNAPEMAVNRASAPKGAAAELAKRKAAAWAAFYQQPAVCEHPPAWTDQVECGNQYMRAKKAFEMQWAEHERTVMDGAVSPVGENQ